MIYWFTGQPGSGKTTLALELMKIKSKKSVHIDGDNLRKIFSNYDYSEKGRRKNIENVIVLAKFLDHKEYDVIISVVSPYRDLRESLKKNNKVTEIYLHTDEKRGRENYFCKDYEKPIKNFISLDTGKMSIQECIKIITTKI